MKKSSLGSLSFILVAALAVVSCSKGKDGATGPAGATGATGATGAAGAANVIYSDWQTVTYQGETLSDGTIIGVADITAPKLVDSIVKKGTVLVYMNWGTSDSPDITPLPYNSALDSMWINVDFAAQDIELTSNFDVSTGTDTAGDVVRQVRYILIPGGVAGRSLINYKDYNAVKKYFGIKN